MDNVIIHKCQDFMVELKKMYPTGIVLGEAKAIVGDLGLTIEWVNADSTVSQQRYKGNERLYITEVLPNNYLLISFSSSHIALSPKLFKGFSKTTNG